MAIRGNMEESKFFKNVWRFNALIIAVAGVLAVVVLLFAGYLIYNEQARTKYKNEIVNIDPETKIEEVFRLGRVKHVNGSQAVIVPLYSDQSFDLRYSGTKSTASTRNLLFSNMHNEESNWLLPTNDYLIPQYNLINKSNSYSSDEDIVTILYRIVVSDTNNDSRLTENDELSIHLSNPDGSEFTEILKNIDDVLGYELINQEALAIMFNRGGQGYTAYVSLKNFEVTKEIELPKIK